MAKVKLYDDDMNVVGAKEFSSVTIKVYDWPDLELGNTGQVTVAQGKALVHEIINGNIIYITNAILPNGTDLVSGFVNCAFDRENPDDYYVLTINYGASGENPLVSGVFVVGEI